jgi:hypothetical protein
MLEGMELTPERLADWRSAGIDDLPRPQHRRAFVFADTSSAAKSSPAMTFATTSRLAARLLSMTTAFQPGRTFAQLRAKLRHRFNAIVRATKPSA